MNLRVKKGHTQNTDSGKIELKKVFYLTTSVAKPSPETVFKIAFNTYSWYVFFKIGS